MRQGVVLSLVLLGIVYGMLQLSYVVGQIEMNNLKLMETHASSLVVEPYQDTINEHLSVEKIATSVARRSHGNN